MTVLSPLSLRVALAEAARAPQDVELVRGYPSGTLERWPASAAKIRVDGERARDRAAELRDPARALRDPDAETRRQAEIQRTIEDAVRPVTKAGLELGETVFSQAAVQTPARILVDHALALTIDIGGDTAAAFERLLRLEGPSTSTRDLVAGLLARGTQSANPDLTMLSAAAVLAGKAPPAERGKLLERVHAATEPIVTRRRQYLRDTLAELVRAAVAVEEALSGHAFFTQPDGPAALLGFGHLLDRIASDPAAPRKLRERQQARIGVE